MSRLFGWDLPPGCSINDIPGNRPEDMAAEAAAQAHDEAVYRHIQLGGTLEQFMDATREIWPDVLAQVELDRRKEAEAEDAFYKQMQEEKELAANSNSGEPSRETETLVPDACRPEDHGC